MLKVKIICIGNLKEAYFKNACAEYAKRLTAFCNFEIIELPEYRLSENPSQKEIDNALEKEAEKIGSKISKGAIVYTMCIEGKQLDSVSLAQKISADTQTASEIVFVIGSSFGIADTLKAKSHFKLSMSKMTFPHQLARVMLCEQIYRAFQITNGGRYHK